MTMLIGGLVVAVLVSSVISILTDAMTAIASTVMTDGVIISFFISTVPGCHLAGLDVVYVLIA